MTGPTYHLFATGDAFNTVLGHAGPARIVLWGGWFCPFTQRTWAALEAKGIPYQYREVNPYLKEKEFLDISPHGLTPGLQVDGRPLHDSNIINEYLEEASGALEANAEVSSLWPKSASGDKSYDKARARLWIDYINKAVVPAFFRLMQATPDTREVAVAEFNTALGHISANCKGPFFYGDDISLVDLAIAPWAVRDFIVRDARRFSRFDVPGWNSWAKALEEHPAILKTTSDPEKYVEFNQTFMRNEGHSAVGVAARTRQTIL